MPSNQLSTPFRSIMSSTGRSTHKSLSSIVKSIKNNNPEMTAREKNLTKRSIMNLNEGRVTTNRMNKAAVGHLESSGLLSSKYTNDPTRALRVLKGKFTAQEAKNISSTASHQENAEDGLKEKKVVWNKDRQTQQADKDQKGATTSLGLEAWQKSHVSIGQAIKDKGEVKTDKEKGSFIDMMID